jgi:N-acetylglutamate synthase-like GNAT family acetyltransferase
MMISYIAVMTNLRKAEISEAERILEFYRNVIDSLNGTRFRPKWNESYPDRQYIEKSIEKGEMHVCTENGNIVSCIVLNDRLDAEYDDVGWNAGSGEIAAIHTFAVNPDCAGRGIGTEIFHQIKCDAIKNDRKAIRIDIIDGNLGAQGFFEKLGFEYVDTVEVFHESVGLEKFHLYEYVL